MRARAACTTPVSALLVARGAYHVAIILARFLSKHALRGGTLILLWPSKAAVLCVYKIGITRGNTVV